MRIKTRLLTTVPLLSLALVACGSNPSGAAGQDPPTTHGFSAHVDNPWFPLEPGTTYRYRGTKDGKRAREVLRVTHAIKTIQGAPNVVLRDKLYLDGKLAESTTDWYSQDRAGNVWYFGERTATINGSGRVLSREGSFQAGVDGARAGIYMPAHPKVGQRFDQEHYAGHAEDRFRIADLAARVKTPLLSTRHALYTIESTRLEPGVRDAKYYVRGIGTVAELQLRGPGPKEQLELVSVSRPRRH